MTAPVALVIWLSGLPIVAGLGDWTTCIPVMDALQQAGVEASCHGRE